MPGLPEMHANETELLLAYIDQQREETARHAGHADFLGEAIDGATMHQLMATVEDWPDSPWLTKWERKPS